MAQCIAPNEISIYPMRRNTLCPTHKNMRRKNNFNHYPSLFRLRPLFENLLSKCRNIRFNHKKAMTLCVALKA
jgi:hypothetical protein